MEEFDRAASLEISDPAQALKVYYSITSSKVKSDDDVQIKAMEQSLANMGKSLRSKVVLFPLSARRPILVYFNRTSYLVTYI